MSSFIVFNEDIYSKLTDESLLDVEKWEETVLLSNECGTVENNPKLRVILELIHHALQFSVTSGLKYSSVAILIEAIQNELSMVIQDTELQITEVDCKSRYVETLKKHTSTNSIPMEDIKTITKFYTENFIRHLASYQYVLQELYTEEQEMRLVEIQTPLIPPSLAVSTEE